MWKSAGRAPSLWILPWHLPYNWGKSTENLSQGKKNLSQVKKNLSQSTVYHNLTTHLQLLSRLRMSGAIPPPPPSIWLHSVGRNDVAFALNSWYNDGCRSLYRSRRGTWGRIGHPKKKKLNSHVDHPPVCRYNRWWGRGRLWIPVAVVCM